METFKAAMREVLEENKQRDEKQTDEIEREKLIREQEFEERRQIREYELERLILSNATDTASVSSADLERQRLSRVALRDRFESHQRRSGTRRASQMFPPKKEKDASLNAAINFSIVNTDLVLPSHVDANGKDIKSAENYIGGLRTRDQRGIRRNNFKPQTVVRRIVGGHPRFTTPAEDRYIAIVAKLNRRATSTRVTSMVTASIGKAISAATVRRRLHMNGLYARVPRICVPLSVQSRKARLKWR
ncbi:HTH_Tnp_Tc3_2 domain-containing protein [Trichonephila clavipes]|nr:HTH_Tnp_Tc3_2 domain-containing protein [Trichonephila clavipes]